MGYNLACILTFPCVQRKGYGRFLIAFSYELSKKEEKVGSPEKPLSDLGALGYKSYWSYTILRSLKTYEGKEITLFDITKITSIAPDDVYATLLSLDLIKEVNQKPILCLSSENIDKLLSKFPETGYGIDADKLHWAPLYIADPRKDKWSIHAKKDSKNTPSNFNIADDINAFHRSTPSCLKMMKAGLSQESLQSLESIEASGNSNNRSAIDTQD